MSDQNMMEMDAVIGYGERGWHVLPLYDIKNGRCACGKPDCQAVGKHPRIKAWQENATTDAATIRSWRTQWPNTNIGIATGKASNLVVLDVDPRHDGNKSLAEYEKQYGNLPDTLTAKTGGNGLHYFFGYPEDATIRNCAGFRPGLDIRADGGYVVAAPSIHHSGNRYEWVDESQKIAEMPETLIQLVKQRDKFQETNLVLYEKNNDSASIPEGMRNDTLASLAGSMRNRGMTQEAILAALIADNQKRCNPPLSEEEVQQIVRSIMRYQPDTSLEQALEVVKNLEAKIDQTPESVYDQENLMALVTLQIKDKSAYGRAVTRLKRLASCKIKDKELDRAVSEMRRRLIGEFSPESNVFEGLLYDFVLPNGWGVTKQGIWQKSEKGDQQISLAPFTISKRMRNMTQGTEKVELLFFRDSKWQALWAERSAIASSSKIVGLADYGFPVNSENSKGVVRYLAAVEDANTIPVTVSTDHLGWVSVKEFLPGASDVTLDVEDGKQSLVKAFNPSGKIEEWTALVAPMRNSPVGRFILAAGFAAPLVKMLRVRNFAIHLWGDSRQGKTAIGKAALSAWGNPEECMMSFYSTKVGLEQQMSFFRNLPVMIDEKQIVADKQDFVDSLMYILGEGKGKTRGTKGGSLANYATWETLTLMTGEHPMSSDNSTTGVKTRVLELHVRDVLNEQQAQALHARLKDFHGTAGPEFIKKIIEYSKELKPLYDELFVVVQEQLSGLMSSHQSALALIGITDALVGQWIFKEDEGGAAKAAWNMISAVAMMLGDKEEADLSQRTYIYFQSFLQENARRFTENCIYEYGWYDQQNKNVVYVNQAVFKREMEQGRFNAKRTIADFIDRGWIEPGKKYKPDGDASCLKESPNKRMSRVLQICLPSD